MIAQIRPYEPLKHSARFKRYEISVEYDEKFHSSLFHTVHKNTAQSWANMGLSVWDKIDKVWLKNDGSMFSPSQGD